MPVCGIGDPSSILGESTDKYSFVLQHFYKPPFGAFPNFWYNSAMWNHPSPTKIYEALGAVADGRILVKGNTAKCYSSSGNKYYDINYDPASKAIMSNDNSSYWTGDLGYPSIAFLLKSGVLEYRTDMGELLQGVAWKDINQKFKNDFSASLKYVLKDLDKDKRVKLQEYVQSLLKAVKDLNLKKLGERAVPPMGY